MKNGVRTNQRLLLVLIVVLGLMGLYSCAAESDRLEPLTEKQRLAVVSRWSEQ